MVRIRKGGERYEILVYSEAALKYRLGLEKDITKVLASTDVFIDFRQGLRASTDKLRKAFGTDDPYRIADFIVKHGDLQIPAELRRKLIEEKRKQIVAFITRNCIDTRTGLPVPALRVEQAMEEVGVSIDPFEDAEVQAKRVLEVIKSIVPLKIETMRIAVKIPSRYIGKAYSLVSNMGSIEKEEWQKDGSWVGIVTIPAGFHGEFIDRLGKATEGGVQVKILK
ncbi:MAG: ribosome assembly factor SBDS [Candidatus Bathyarchaeota archaeon]|nr:ribosome assembly factor SBDS [Candidatus Bathyarchaeota archaeon]